MAHPAAGDQVRRACHLGFATRGSGRARAGEPGGPGPPDRPRPRRPEPSAGSDPSSRSTGGSTRPQVTGTIGAVLDGTPLTVHRLWGARADVGRHPPRAGARDGPVHRRAADPAAGCERTRARRSVSTARRGGAQLDEQPARPRCRARPGARSLVLPENANPGWRAMLDGRQLTPRAHRRLDAGLLPARGRRRQGHAGVHPEPALPGRARARRDCWPFSCWEPRSWSGVASRVPRRCQDPGH